MAALIRSPYAWLIFFTGIATLPPRSLGADNGLCKVVPLRGDGTPVQGELPQGCRIRDFRIDPKTVTAKEITAEQSDAWIDAYDLRVTRPGNLEVFVVSQRVDTVLSVYSSNLTQPKSDDDARAPNQVDPMIRAFPVQPGLYQIFVYGKTGKNAKAGQGKYQLTARCGDCAAPLPEPGFKCSIIEDSVGCYLLPGSPHYIAEAERLEFEFRFRSDSTAREMQAGPPIRVPASSPFDICVMKAAFAPGTYKVFLLIDGRRSSSEFTVEVKRPVPPDFDCRFDEDTQQPGEAFIDCSLKPEFDAGSGQASFEISLRMQAGSQFVRAAAPVEIDRDAAHAIYRVGNARFPGRYRVKLLIDSVQKGGVVDLDRAEATLRRAPDNSAPCFECQLEEGEQGGRVVTCKLKPPVPTDLTGASAELEFFVRLRSGSPFARAALQPVDSTAPEMRYRIPVIFPGTYRVRLLLDGRPKGGTVEMEVSLP